MALESMSVSQPPPSLPALLEELRRVAQLGLRYSADPFDRERYGRLLRLASEQYAGITGLPATEINDRFRAELGHITPKVGVDAAIFDDAGRLLLTRRADDRRWCLPCGWAELGESPVDSLRREVMEETGLVVEVAALLDVRWRLPGEYGPHTSYHILYHCVRTGGALAVSDESVEVAYRDPADVTGWHADHESAARTALRFHHGLLAAGLAPLHGERPEPRG